MQLNPSVSKNPSRKTQLQTSHALLYGLLDVAKDVSGAVSCVQCQLCQYFWREMAVDGKRKRTRTVEDCHPGSETLQFSFPSTIDDDLIGIIFFNSDEEVPVEHALHGIWLKTKRNVLSRTTMPATISTPPLTDLRSPFSEEKSASLYASTSTLSLVIYALLPHMTILVEKTLKSHVEI
ncbi:hypothetical protein PHMEG_00020470 [Phytophthora megakarya]|uniref:Uncharacterized protein n=1 Tax=Phytophthora megakarya TaxID=4795 RepID=A0A225VPB5_9STRA|nr:hypothetical protein PHMEG_00020470 [Phytophthora megakarya]